MTRSLCSALAVCLATAAATPLAAQARPEWTLDDILTQETAGSFDFSPDGRYLVWTKSHLDRESGRRHVNLWLTRLADRESWALTHGKETHGSPRFSPDSRLIVFTSTREVPEKSEEAAGPQLWAMRVAGGEAYALTSGLRGLRQWTFKGTSSDTLVLTANETQAERDHARKKRSDTGYAVEDTLDAPPVRIWSLALKDRKLKRLTDNPDPIQVMAVSPDGTRAVTRNTVSLSYGFDARTPPKTYLVELATGARREILTTALDHDGRAYPVVPGALEWAKDGTGVYVGYDYSSHPVYRSATITLLSYYDVAADRLVRVPLDWERGIASFTAAPGGFYALLEDGVRVKPARYTANGGTWKRAWVEGEHVGRFSGLTLSPDGRRVAYSMSEADVPTQPYHARVDGTRIRDPQRITELNAGFAKKPALRAEVVRWRGANEEEVEGILYYPVNHVAGRRYPLVLSIHGGPASADRDAWSQGWSAPAVLYNQRGAFALKVNYHGSSGYGLAWVESIADGKYYDLEIPDIERGVDTLIAQGLVHADSVATAGWSNGAILSTALTVANPARYRAAIIGAGDVEWISDWGNVDFGASFDNYYFGASPLEDPQRYIDKSPFFKLDRVHTPTLLFTGTEDRNVPPSQSWSHFRALQQLGHAPTRLVLFPGEPHGLGKYAHQRQKVEEELRWLDQHLWGRADTVNLALREGSPLAHSLRLLAAARTGDRLGVLEGGVLVPETVARDSFHVGRFEVTRAQWQAFDAGYPIPAGTGDYPVSDIGFEQAQAYVRWLAERTGKGYRLPTRREWESLGGGSGNTLDHWAGYAPNPEDAARLQALLGRLGGGAPLLRTAGSFGADAAGDPPVFDLGGNVAEWAIETDGTGAAVGPSADRARDPSARERGAAPAYRGLRVILDN